MEIGMRWVYQQVKDRHGIPLEAGQKPSLCFRARKFMLCVAAGHPVRVIKRPAVDFDRCRQVVYQGKEDYPISRAVEQFSDIGLRNGITEGARKLLQRAAEMVDDLDLDEEEFVNEEDLMYIKSSEKPGEEVVAPSSESGDTTTDSNSTSAETTIMESASTATSKVKRPRVKKDRPATKKAATNGATKAKKVARSGKPYVPSADSKLGKAVAYMREEVKKAGGASKLERGFLKELFERTAKKVGVAVATASAQYNRQIRSKG